MIGVLEPFALPEDIPILINPNLRRRSFEGKTYITNRVGIFPGGEQENHGEAVAAAEGVEVVGGDGVAGRGGRGGEEVGDERILRGKGEESSDGEAAEEGSDAVDEGGGRERGRDLEGEGGGGEEEER